ncbi:MAG: bifunctional phosphopantothenoylcysteine decarboxylase/phosphopantothenate--cysteine ligase CoaBC [Deltaproteobacteria bacterium]|nr:bifunctional phosphopantothenoylcysteine decarboxylase/phosphopantothenate--cysteine ligase CoaBC [Deltaproteobacteria bacterium]
MEHATVIVGVSGGIAAYKAVELVRLLGKLGVDVHVAMTRGATQFVTPLTFSALTKHPVEESVWHLSERGEIGHVVLGHQAKLIVIAPATATTIARLAMGLADDALTALVLASTCPVLLAPAMETNMWTAPATQKNVATLVKTGRYTVIGPESGALASGAQGMGRMSEPDLIAWHAEKALTPQDFAGVHMIVTAGPTREPLDPVRFISNRSSGKMGFAIAERAAMRGAQVTLVHGPVALDPPRGVHAVAVTSAVEMLDSLQALMKRCQVLVMAAAVADYAAQKVAKKKLKKQDLGKKPAIALTQNPDVIATIAKAKKKSTLLVGFAAETNDVEANALKKLRAKGLDLIVANDISAPGVGMDSDDNKVTIYDRRGVVLETERSPKTEIAEALLKTILDRL